MICQDCDQTVDVVYPVIRMIKPPSLFKIGWVCKGCFAHYGKKEPPEAR